MKKLLTFCLLLSISSYTFSQITFNQLYEDGRGIYVQQTDDNGYIITGAERVNDSSHIIVIKTDEYGTVLWSKDLGYGEGNYIKQIDDGEYFIAGYEGYSFNLSAFWAKINNVGDIIWSKSSPFNYDDIATSAKKTSDGGYIIVGQNYQNYPVGNTFIIKTNEVGDTLWTKIYGGQYGSSAKCVQETSDDGYIIVGHQSWEYPYGSGYIMKTDNNGDSLWVNYGWSGFHSVIQTEDGGYVTSGNSLAYGGPAFVTLARFDIFGDMLWGYQYDPFGEIYLSFGSEVQQTEDGGFIIAGSGACLIKTNSEGDSVWMNYYDEEGCLFGNSVQLTSDGGYIVTGGGANNRISLFKTDGNGVLTWTNEIALKKELRVYPNPFYTSTTIEYTLSSPQTVTIIFYNQFGKEVDQIEHKQLAGKQQVNWVPELPGGVYYFRLEAGEHTTNGKLILMR